MLDSQQIKRLSNSIANRKPYTAKQQKQTYENIITKEYYRIPLDQIFFSLF